MFKALFGQNNSTRDAHLIYGAVVARARDGKFFDQFGIPDTFDGRFEMLVMHLFIVHARLKDESPVARKTSQLVFDNFINDMDGALREAGVGDPSVPKRIAKMTQVFYGRTGAYENALAGDQPQSELAKVIARNLYPEGGERNNWVNICYRKCLICNKKVLTRLSINKLFFKGPIWWTRT